MQNGILPPPRGGFQGATRHRAGGPGPVPAPIVGQDHFLLTGAGAWSEVLPRVAGQAGKDVRVNATETGFEYVLPPNNPMRITAKENVAAGTMVSIDDFAGRIVRTKSIQQAQDIAIGSANRVVGICWVEEFGRFYVLSIADGGGDGVRYWTLTPTLNASGDQIASLSATAASASMASDVSGDYSSINFRGANTVAYDPVSRTMFLSTLNAAKNAYRILRFTLSADGNTLTYQNAVTLAGSYTGGAYLFELVWQPVEQVLYGFWYLHSGILHAVLYNAALAELVNTQSANQPIQSSNVVSQSSDDVTFSACYVPAANRVALLYSSNITVSGNRRIRGTTLWWNAAGGALNRTTGDIYNGNGTTSNLILVGRIAAHPFASLIYVPISNDVNSSSDKIINVAWVGLGFVDPHTGLNNAVGTMGGYTNLFNMSTGSAVGHLYRGVVLSDGSHYIVMGDGSNVDGVVRLTSNGRVFAGWTNITSTNGTSWSTRIAAFHERTRSWVTASPSAGTYRVCQPIWRNITMFAGVALEAIVSGQAGYVALSGSVAAVSGLPTGANELTTGLQYYLDTTGNLTTSASGNTPFGVPMGGGAVLINR